MIFYFSATGNSLWTAQLLGKHFNLPLVSVTEAKKKSLYRFDVTDISLILFVFPVHSWGPALSMLSFIDNMELKGLHNQLVYAICTCGDDCGQTNKIIRKALVPKGISLMDTFSVSMPNSYILLPGFDIDSKEVETEKLNLVPDRINQIIQVIENEKKASMLYYPGKASFLKSCMIYPLFKNFITGKTKFKATDKCISCGICIKVCPENNISMDNSTPEWGNKCVQCLACIHGCPKHAIEYGTITINKGRYQNPQTHGILN